MNALPTLKPNRRKRFALKFAMLVVAAFVLSDAYWFTRSPELVWWTSPKLHSVNGHIRLLIPKGWEMDTSLGDLASRSHSQYLGYYDILPTDHRVKLLRCIFPNRLANAGINIEVVRSGNSWKSLLGTGIHRFDTQDAIGVIHEVHDAEAYIDDPDHGLSIHVEYAQSYLPAFNRTYRQICNSLRIE